MKKLMLCRAIGIFAVTNYFAPVTASAAILFQSGPNFAIDAQDMLASSRSDGSPYRVYDIFTLASTSIVNSVTFAIQTNFGVPPTINVAIFPIASDGRPNTGPSTTIMSLNIANANLARVSNYISDEDADYNTTLLKATLPATQIGAGRYYISFYSAAGLSVPIYQNDGNSVYQTGLNGFYRNTSTAFKLEGDLAGAVVPSVPEPTAWAMMLVGFGIAGGLLRRRRAAYLSTNASGRTHLPMW